MDFLINNWPVLVGLIAVIVVAAIAVKSYFGLPREEQIARVKEWLLWAVTKAEKELGGGTGQLKLRYVYDMFVTRFPTVSKFITFETFSNMVDQALEKMRHLLETNTQIEAYVKEGE